jgi:hypothetical protein
MTGAGRGIADVNLPQHSIKWREKSGLEILISLAFRRKRQPAISNHFHVSSGIVLRAPRGLQFVRAPIASRSIGQRLSNCCAPAGISELGQRR